MKKLFVCLLFFMLSVWTSCYAKPVSIDYNDGIYHIILKGEKIKKKIKVYSSGDLMTNEEVHNKSGAILTVNGGFFDPNNSKTISYITMDRQTMEDPMLNENLLANPVLRKNLSKIINRTEFRIVECDNKYMYEIVSHNAPVDFACTVTESVQGGPLILPDLHLEEEFFIVREDGKVIRESGSVLHKTARTILGLKDDELHILIITDENPMDMYEVQVYCKSLGLTRAMGLDGGSSTSMNYKNKYSVISLKGDGAGRRLKSFIMVFK